MEIIGKIIRAFDPVSGTSKAGREWKKREYLMEIPSNNIEYGPRQVFFNFFGNSADQYVLDPGKTYKILFDIESREYNGRYYTDIRAWRAEEQVPGQAGAPQAVAGAPVPQFEQYKDPLGSSDNFVGEEGDMGDNLPF